LRRGLIFVVVRGQNMGMSRIVAMEGVREYREELRQGGRVVVGTNGCFDVLHYGHVSYLERARGHGDFLWVGINDDAGVRALKGEGRPLNAAEDRARVLAALRCVDAVTVFGGERAVDFLRALRPDVYVKGGDYTEETLDAGERAVLRACGARLVIEGLVEGRSTSGLVARIRGGRG
jgi:rfaE bifunctional protein nucleotidyltransferase chain/domain